MLPKRYHHNVSKLSLLIGILLTLTISPLVAQEVKPTAESHAPQLRVPPPAGTNIASNTPDVFLSQVVGHQVEIWSGAENNLTTIFIRMCSAGSTYLFRSEKPQVWLSDLFVRSGQDGCSPNPSGSWRIVVNASPGEQFRIYSLVANSVPAESDFMIQARRDICTVDAPGSVSCYQESGSAIPIYPYMLFNDPNYLGSYCYSENTGSYTQHADCDNQSSSLLLQEGWSLRVFNQQDLNGPNQCLSESISDLSAVFYNDGSAINDTISSVILYNSPTCPQYQTIPNTPSNLSLTDDDTSYILSWLDNATNEDGYRVYRWDGTLGDWVIIANLAANSTTFADRDVICGIGYFYEVAAFNAAGESLRPRIESEPLECNPVSDSIQNGNFESGDLRGWDVPQGSTVIVTERTNPVYGDYVAYFGGINDANEEFFQRIALPDRGVGNARLSFWLNMFGQEFSEGADRFCVGIYTEDRSQLLVDFGCLDGAATQSSTFASSGWWKFDTSLLGYWNQIRGKTVAIRFQMNTDFSLPTTVYVDDVFLETTDIGAIGDLREPNNTPSEATPLAVEEILSALSINPNDDRDFFVFSGDAGDTAIVDINARTDGSALDSVIEIYNQQGNVICQNDDDGATYDSYLTCQLPYTGSYYVMVRSYDSSGSVESFYSIGLNMTEGSVPPPPEIGPTPTPVVPPEGKTWTAILYLAGDNNLCASYPHLIERMENELGNKIGTNGFLNVVVLFDQHPGECDNNNNGHTVRYVIQPNGQYQDGVTRWDLGELNTGDPQTLIDFARWSMENYPAEHYYLAIDNHGAGLGGMAWDETDNANISNAELFTALKEITNNGQQTIDVLAYESCLMGLYENAYDMRHFADYLFSFETISFASRASYPSYLGDSRFTSDATGRDLGTIMFEIYYNNVREPYVLSLVDLAQVDALHSAVDSWSSAIRSTLPNERDAILAARSDAQKIDTNNDGELSDVDNVVDLWHVADRLAARGVAESESNALKATLESAVILHNQRSSSQLNYANAKGLGIYWPLNSNIDGLYSAYTNGSLYNSSASGVWDDFLSDLLGNTDRRSMSLVPRPAERLNAQESQESMVYLPFIVRQ